MIITKKCVELSISYKIYVQKTTTSPKKCLNGDK